VWKDGVSGSSLGKAYAASSEIPNSSTNACLAKASSTSTDVTEPSCSTLIFFPPRIDKIESSKCRPMHSGLLKGLNPSTFADRS